MAVSLSTYWYLTSTSGSSGVSVPGENLSTSGQKGYIATSSFTTGNSIIALRNTGYVNSLSFTMYVCPNVNGSTAYVTFTVVAYDPSISVNTLKTRQASQGMGSGVLDYDTDYKRVSTAGWTELNFNLSNLGISSDYIYLRFYCDGNNYYQVGSIDVSSSSGGGGGTVTPSSYYYYRSYDITSGSYITSSQSTTSSSISRPYPSGYTYLGWVMHTSYTACLNQGLDGTYDGTGSTASPSSTYPYVVFFFEQEATETYYYSYYDITDGRYLSKNLVSYSGEAEAPTKRGYNYLGYVWHSTTDNCLDYYLNNGRFDGTDNYFQFSSNQPCVIFFYEQTVSSWQTPTLIRSINQSTSYTGTGYINCYQAGYIRYYTPSYVGKLVIKTTSGGRNPDYYSHLSTSLLSAKSGTSRSGAVSGSILTSNDDYNSTEHYDTQISYVCNAYTYYYWYVNAAWAESGTYSVPYQLNYYRRYYVSFNANGGSGAPSTQYFYTDNPVVTIPSTTPTKSGYTFLGWSTSSSASSPSYYKGSSYSFGSSNYTLYAVWKANTVTLTYNANNGSGAPASSTVSIGSTWSINTSPSSINRNGYTFKGWSTSSSAITPTYKKGNSYSITASSNLTLYAVWWPTFTWTAYNATNANILKNYIVTYIGGSLNNISTGDPRLASWYNSLANQIDAITISPNIASFKSQLDDLANAYNNF